MLHALKQAAKSVLPAGVQNGLRKMRVLSRLAWTDLRLNVLGDVFPPKPDAISMMANDVCNSRCQMCLIWEQKKDKELTPAELRQVLAEPLFSRVRNIGVTGGEPTLRKDLPELFRVITAKRPRLDGASIISNGIRATEVQERVVECARICREAGIGFDVMLSLDGLGEVHDTVRGRQGNFQTVMQCFERFQAEGIPVIFGCTITKSNAAYMDELLDWAMERGHYGRFRVAEFIDRLYNAPQKEFIRSFDPLTQYHLGLFYYRLEHGFETNPTYRKTYRSIRGMLVEGRPRTTGCPYHHSAVILTARGELLYCSPKSPVLGSILEAGSAAKVFFGNLHKKKEIREKHCDNCVHDYHVPETFREKVEFLLKHRRQHRHYNCADLVKRTARVRKDSAGVIEPSKLASKRVLIVGWYGTETTGDKAILWGVVNRLRQRAQPPEEILVSSLHPFVTEWTKHELGLPELRVVETFSTEFETACDSVDEVVVGGGPLMDLEILNHILHAFTGAARRGKIARVEGCGLGPLHESQYIATVREILRMADHITLRDAASVKRCGDEFGRQAVTEHDPAQDYLLHLMRAASPPLKVGGETGRVVNFFLRDLPAEYAGDISGTEFKGMQAAFEEQLLTLMAELVAKHDCKINLLPMHTFFVGGDDRILNRRLARRLVSEQGVPVERVSCARLPMSPEEICRAMMRGAFNVCMRYHSVFFAETLGVNYVALDYTRGGKIPAFLKDVGRLDRLITLPELAAGHWRGKIGALLVLKKGP